MFKDSSTIDQFMKDVQALAQKADSLGLNMVCAVGCYDPKAEVAQSNYMTSGCYHACLGLIVELKDKLLHPEMYSVEGS